MATELIQCPRCGAIPVAPPDAHASYTCGYCGSHFQARHAQSAVPVPRTVMPPVTQPQRTNATLPILLAILGGFAVLICFGAGVVLALRAKDSAPAPHKTDNPQVATPPVLLNAPATSEAPEVKATAEFKFHSRIAGYKSSFYALGFVTNTSPFTIDKPKVTAVLRDASGKEIATRDGYAECDVLEAKASAPIKVLVSDPPAHAKIDFEVVASKATYIPDQINNLKLEIIEPPRANFGSSYQVSGKVHNSSSDAAKFVHILILAYDTSNHLIGVDSTYADGDVLAAGADARFRAMPLYEKPPHRFEYSVSARPAK